MQSADGLTPGARRGEALLLAALFVLLCAYFYWAVAPAGGPFAQPASTAYYNLLVDGFQAGHTYLPIEPDPHLLALANPYDLHTAGPYMLHDTAYFNHHFYLYFGVTPAVTLYWPWRILTGHSLSDAATVWIDVCLGLGFGMALLARIRWRFFPQSPRWHLVTAALALGLCTMLPSFVSRPGVWEVPISSAYAFSNAAFLLIFTAAYGRRPALSLALASLCYGLAVGARPTFAFGAVFLLAPVWTAWPAPGAGRRRVVLARLAAAVLPISAVVAGMLAYNHARFGHPLDFGFGYQMTGADERTLVHFSLGYLPFDAHVYLFSPARWSVYFPFVRLIDAPPQPPGYLGIEDPYGILTNLPVTLFVLAALWAWRGSGALRPYLTGLLAALLIVTLTLFLFGGATNRYMVEFLPLWILVAGVGLFATGSGRLRRLLGTLWALAFAISVVFGLGSGLGHNDLLRINRPESYAPLAHALDWPARAAALAADHRFRPVTLTVKFPKGRQGALEPLLVSGLGLLSDYVYVHYPNETMIVIGFEHAGHGGPVTQPIRIDFDRPHEITIEAGFLYPPIESPYFDHFSRAEALRRKSQYRVTVDGTPYLAHSVEVYDPVALGPRIGWADADQAAFGTRFTGEILKVADGPLAPVPAPPPLGRPLRLSVRFPAFSGRRNEPIVTTGVTGAGDSLVVTYLDDRHVSFMLDHWGIGSVTSEPIAIDPHFAYTLTISLGSFYTSLPAPAGVIGEEWSTLQNRLYVTLDQTRVFDRVQAFHPAAAIAVGANPIGASTSTAAFTGELLDQGTLPLSAVLR